MFLAAKNVIFPSIYPPHLLPTAFGSMDFILFCRLVQLSGALYEVHVLRAGSLSRASFRFRVAADSATRPRSIVPQETSGRRKPPSTEGACGPLPPTTATAAFTAQDLHLVDNAHAGHTKRGERKRHPPPKHTQRRIFLFQAPLPGEKRRFPSFQTSRSE